METNKRKIIKKKIKNKKQRKERKETKAKLQRK